MDEMKPWWKTWPVLGVAALLVVLALGGGGMILGSKLGEAGGSETVPASPSSGDSEAAPATPAGDGEASVCGLTAREDEMGKLETEAPVTEWESLGNQLVTKKNETHGPGVVEDDGFRYCYARTPEGVLFAAANFFALGASADDERKSKIVDHLLVDNGRKDEFLNDKSSAGGTTNTRVAAYSFTSYTADRASVNLVLDVQGKYGKGTVDFEWVDGDWRLSPPGGGPVVYNVEQVDNLAGFVPWGV